MNLFITRAPGGHCSEVVFTTGLTVEINFLFYQYKVSNWKGVFKVTRKKNSFINYHNLDWQSRNNQYKLGGLDLS
jgi:hypothetical protein